MFKRAHEHRWISVSSQYADHGRYDDGEHRHEGGRTIPQTLVLQLCACGGYHIQRLDGTWEREELGIDAAVVRDLYSLLHEVA